MEKCLCKVFLRCKLGTRVYFSFAFPLNKITLLLKIYFLFYILQVGFKLTSTIEIFYSGHRKQIYNVKVNI